MIIRWLWIIIVLAFAVPHVYAGGLYVVGRDDQGVYLQTDKGNSWYIGRRDLKYFTVGEKGQYTVGRDSKGTYIKAGKNRKFYVANISDAQVDKEIEAFNKSQNKMKRDKGESRVVVVGNQVLVPVTFQNDFRKVDALLLLDTGAAITVLHRDVAEQLKLKPLKKGRAQVVGGKTIPMTLTMIDSLETGGVRKNNLQVGIIDHQGMQTRDRGFLGMNFLQGLRYKINYQKQTIQWDN